MTIRQPTLDKFVHTPLGPIHESWQPALAPVYEQLESLATFLDAESRIGAHVLPAREAILRAFSISFDSVRIVIVGQDPYPTAGHAVGLAFSVAPHTQPLPRSLNNIFRELVADVGCPQPRTGDLSPWTQHGVMLLNRVLTVREGEAGSHRGHGWEAITECALRALDARSNQPLIAILWGRDAQRAQGFMPNSVVIESAHPSPLSASRGFFGSWPFSRANAALVAQGAQPIDWSLD
jgi:uracil-DNA glycosylase